MSIMREVAELQDAYKKLIDGKRLTAACKAENDRLNRENLWLTGGITDG